MPDPFERHARTKYPSGWESQNPRSARAAAAAEPEVKRPPGKKDPNLCKAAHWKRPHTLELRIRQFGWRRGAKCGWDVSWGGEKPAYFCRHEAVCTGCGKITSTSINFNDCPDSVPLSDERRAEIEEKIEQDRERRARYRARRNPVIDGPQGYRKPKESK